MLIDLFLNLKWINFHVVSMNSTECYVAVIASFVVMCLLLHSVVMNSWTTSDTISYIWILAWWNLLTNTKYPNDSIFRIWKFLKWKQKNNRQINIKLEKCREWIQHWLHCGRWFSRFILRTSHIFQFSVINWSVCVSWMVPFSISFSIHIIEAPAN